MYKLKFFKLTESTEWNSIFLTFHKFTRFLNFQTSNKSRNPTSNFRETFLRKSGRKHYPKFETQVQKFRVGDMKRHERFLKEAHHLARS